MRKLIYFTMALALFMACSQEESLKMDSSTKAGRTIRVNRISQDQALQRMWKFMSSTNPATRSENIEIDDIYSLTLPIEPEDTVLVVGNGTAVDTIAVQPPHTEEIAYAYVINFKDDGGYGSINRGKYINLKMLTGIRP